MEVLADCVYIQTPVVVLEFIYKYLWTCWRIVATFRRLWQCWSLSPSAYGGAGGLCLHSDAYGNVGVYLQVPMEVLAVSK